MRVADFDFELPEELIAQSPTSLREQSRLLHVNGAVVKDHQFTDILNLVQPGDVMVFNNTQVIKARLFGEKASGGKIEVLVERVLDDKTVLAHVRASKSPKAGTYIHLGEYKACMVERMDSLFKLAFESDKTVFEILDEIGHLPLPPYIERSAEQVDDLRYQTVYAKEKGAVAAPTAGLHFSEAILDALREKGVLIHFVTLHVGAGTFQPVRVDEIKDHVMHSEIYNIPAETVDAIYLAHAQNKRVIAVGTTSLRALESAAQSGSLRSGAGETSIFITPGYRFVVVNTLVTNFHLPKSTLMMLVSAFAGYDEICNAYQHAIKQAYRFFSYGDAMWLEPKNTALMAKAT